MFTTTSSDRLPIQRLIAGCLIVLQVLTPVLYTGGAWAQAAPATVNADRSVQGQRPVVNVAANGVPVVQISPPSAAGVSNNRFTDYNVGEKGLILNNTGANNQTQLAGWIAGNPMLGNTSAKTILNQVTGSTPTSLAGYTEVAGNQANVVVANPNGITCAGCGFINAPRVTLSTGTPELDADGALQGFRVQQGQIAFEGTGLAARNVDQVDLISRSLRLNAEVWANKLEIATGAGQVDYATGKVTAQPAATDITTAPQVSVDVSQLGGMYANSIRMVGTESGVGVNNAGNIAALTGTLEISQAGDVRIVAGSLQSKEDLSIRSEASVSNDGAVHAEGKAVISAGGNLDNTGVLMAGKALQVQAAGISNAGSIAAGAAADGKITAAEDLSLAATGDVNNSGQLVAGKNLTVTGKNVKLDNGNLTASSTATLTAGASLENRNSSIQANDIAIDAAGRFVNVDGTVESQERLSITAPQIDNTRGTLKQIAEAVDAEQQGLVIANRHDEAGTSARSDTSADFLINDSGLIASNASSEIKVQSVTNAGGTIQSANGLAISGERGIDNTKGKLLATGALQLTTDGKVINQGGQVSADTSVSVSAKGELDNSANGSIQGQAVRLGAAAIDNSGGSIVQTGNESQTIALSGSFKNVGGSFQSNAQIVTLSADSIDNTQGQILHGGSGAIHLNAVAGINNAKGSISGNSDVGISAGTALANAGGTISGKGNLSLAAGTLDNNSGTITAEGDMALQASGAVDNRGGTLLSNGRLALTAGSLANGANADTKTGSIVAAGTGAMSLGVGGKLDNASGIIIGAGDVTLSAGSLDNSGGTVSAKGGIDARVSGGLDNRDGTFLAEGTLTADVGGTLDNGQGMVQGDGLEVRAGSIANASGTIQQAGTGTATISATGAIDNAQGQILGDSLNLTAGSIDNSAGIISAQGGALAIESGGAVDNTGGKLISAGTLGVKAGSIVNTKDGRIQSASSTDLKVDGDLSNTGGTLLSGDKLSVSAGGDIDNRAGVIDAATDIRLTAQNVHNGNGSIIARGDGNIAINVVKSLDNTDGTVGSNGSIAILAGDGFNNTRGTVTTGKDLEIDTVKFLNKDGKLNVSGALTLKMKDVLDNRGSKLEAQGGLIIHAAGIENGVDNFGVKGELLVRGEGLLKLQTEGDINNAGGRIGSRGDVALAAGGKIDNSAGAVFADKSVSLNAGEVNNTEGELQAGTALTSSIAGAFDNRQGIVQADTMQLQAGTLDNREGELLQLGTGGNTLSIEGDFNNAGGRLSSNGDTLHVAAGSIANGGGLIAHDGDGRLDIVSTGTVDNSGGSILTEGELGIDVQHLANSLRNGQAGRIQSGKQVGISVGGDLGNVSGSIVSNSALQVAAGGNFDNRDGIIQADRALAVSSGTLDNTQGTIKSLDNSGVHVSGVAGIVNAKGFISGNGDVTVGTEDGGLDNTEGAIEAKQALTVAAMQDIDNREGKLQAGTALTVSADGTLDNRAGTVQGDSVNLRAGNLDNRGGSLLHVGDAEGAVNVDNALSNTGGTIYSAGSALRIDSGSVDNSEGDILHEGSGELVIAAATLNNDGGRVLTDGALAIDAHNVSNDKRNGTAGLIQAGKDASILASGKVSNVQGQIASAAALTVNATGDLDNTDGIVEAANGLTLHGDRIDNTQGSIASLDDSGVAVYAVKGLINEQGSIEGNGSIAVDVRDGGIANEKGKILAGRSLAVTAGGLVDNREGTLQAADTFSSDIGGLLDNRSGLLQAGRMDLQAGSLDNRSGSILQLDTAENTASTVRIDGELNNASGSLHSNNSALTISAADIDNAEGEIIHAGDVALTIANTGLLNNEGGKILTDAALSVQSGDISNTARSGKAGLIQSKKGAAISASGDIGNAAGIITSDAALSVQAGENIDNRAGTLESNGALSLQAKNLDNTDGHAVSIDSSGMTVHVGSVLTNDDGLLGGNGAMAVHAGFLANTRGRIAAKTNLTVTADSLSNIDGDIVADNALHASVADAFDNTRGKIQADALAIDAGALDNSAGRLLATGANTLNLNVTNDAINTDGFIGGNGSVILGAGNVSNTQGTIYAKDALNIATGRLDNAGGTLEAETTLSVQAQDGIDNRQGLMQADAFQLQAPELDNRGGRLIQLGTSDTALAFSGALNNATGVIATNGVNLSLAASGIDNSGGEIRHAGNGKFDIRTGTLDNDGATLLSAGEIAIDAQQVSNTVLNGQGGTIEGDKDVAIASAGDIDNTGGRILSGAALRLASQARIANSDGTMQAAGALALQANDIDNTGGHIASLGGSDVAVSASDTLTNREGFIGGNGNMTLAAGQVDNVDGTAYAKQNLTVNAGTLDNTRGTLEAGGTLTVKATQKLINKQGALQAEQLVVQTPTMDNSAGKILQLGDGDLAFSLSGTLDNTQGSIATNGRNLTLAAAAIDNTDGDIRHAGNGKFDIASSGTLVNTGGKLRSAGAVAIDAQAIDGARGLIQSSQSATITTAGNFTNTDGSLLSSGALAVQAGGSLDNKGGTLEAANALSMQAANVDNTRGRAVSLNAGGVTVGTAGTLHNDEGMIGGNGAAVLSAGVLRNKSGTLSAVTDLGIAANTIDNAGGSIKAGGALSASASDSLGNAGGTIEAVTMAVNAGSLDNSLGKLLATGADPFAVTVTGNAVNTGGFIGGNGAVSITAESLDNTGGTVYAKSDLDIGANALDNTEGTLQTDNALTIAVEEELVNRQGTLQARQLALQAPSLDNSEGKILQTGSGDTRLVFAGAVRNAKGTIATNGVNLTLNASSIDNSQGELTHAGSGKFDMATGALDNDGGKLRSGGGIAIDAQNVTSASGLIESKAETAIASASDVDNTDGAILSGAALTIHAQNRLTNAGGTVEAARALDLQAAEIDNTKGRAVSLDNSGARITASGTLSNEEGAIGGNGAVALTAASLNNIKGRVTGIGNVDITAPSVTNTGGVIKSQQQLTLDVGDAGFLSNTQQGLLQGERLNLNAPNLSNAGGSIIQTGSSDTHLQINGTLDNVGGTIASNGNNMRISAQAIANNGGAIKHGGSHSLTLTMPGAIANSGGSISSNGNAIVSGTVITNTAGGAIDALGTLNVGASQALNNNGGVLQSDGALRVSTPDMSNNGGAVLTDGKLTLDVPGFNNTGGTLSANQIAFQPMSSVRNAGGKILQTGAYDLNLVVSQDIDNTGGTIAANGNVTLGGTTLKNQGGTVRAAGSGSLNVTTTGAIDNAGGTLAAGRDLNANASSLNNQGGQVTAAGRLTLGASGNIGINNNQGTIASNGDNQIHASSLSNRGGTVASNNGTLVLNTPSHIDNTGGRLHSAGNLSLNVPGLTNTNGQITAGSLQIDTRGNTLDNAGGRIISSGALDIRSGQLNNHAGLLQANGSLRVNTNGQALINTQSGGSNGIVGLSDVTLTTGSLNNQGGYIGAKSTLDVTASGINNSQGAIVSEGSVKLTASSLTNTGGQISGKGNVDIKLGNGTFDNSNGLAIAAGSLTVDAGHINNSNTAAGGADKGLQGRDVTLNAGTISNSSGTIRADNLLTLNGASFDNSNGTVSSANTVINNAGSTTNTQGTLIAANRLAMRSNAIHGVGQYLSHGDLEFNYEGSYNNSSRMVAAGNLTIKSKGTITNSGQIGAKNVLNLGAVDIYNMQSGEIKAGTANITVSNSLTNHGIIDGGTVNIDANGDVVNHNRIYGDTLDIDAGGHLANADRAVIGARQALTLRGGNITNYTDALILSTGDMSLNSPGKVYNRSGRIESFGNMTINAGGVENRNDFLTMTTQVVGTENIVGHVLPGSATPLAPGSYAFNDVDKGRLVLDSAQYPLPKYGAWPYPSAFIRWTTGEGEQHVSKNPTYTPEHPVWALFGVTPPPGPALTDPMQMPFCNDDGRGDECSAYIQVYTPWFAQVMERFDQLDQKISAFNRDLNSRMVEDWYIVNATRTTTETRASGDSKPGQIFVGGNLVLNGQGGSVRNEKSQIIVGGGISGSAADVVQVEDKNIRQKTDVGTWQLTELVSSGIFGGHKRTWHAPGPYSVTHTPENLGGATVWQFKTHTAPQRSNQLAAKQTIQVGQSANGAADANRHVHNLQGANGATGVGSGSAGGITANPNGGSVTGAAVTQLNGQSAGNVQGVAGVVAQTVAGNGAGEVSGSGQAGSINGAVAATANAVSGADGTAVAGASAETAHTVNGTANGSVAATVQSASVSTANGNTAGSVTGNAQAAAIGSVSGNAGSNVTASMQSTAVDAAGGSAANSITGGPGQQYQVDGIATQTAVAGPHAASAARGSAASNELVEVRADGNGNLTVRSITPTLALPGNLLFSTRSEPGARYLVETDPRFADYRTWLSSDFMLQQLGRDPLAVLKRLGDGFYEQKLVADQIMHATGRRFVGDYRDNEAQYQALMQNGIAFGKQFQLTVGVALSAEQMQQLTEDIVWLVEQDVVLADGSVQRVLAPQAYVRVKEGDLRGDGTLISARSIDLNLTGDLNNNALIATRDMMNLAAQNIGNVSGGRLQGGTVNLAARNDIDNLSGIIAGNAVTLEAGRDINIRTRTLGTAGLGTTNTGTDVIAGVTGESLTISAGRDLNVAGAKIDAGKDALLTANRDIAIGTVQTGRTLDIAVSGHLKAAEVKNVGSTVSAGENLIVASGRKQDGDLKVTGSTLSAGKDLTAIGTNVTIASAIDTLDADIVTKKKNATDTVLRHQESAVASALSAGENLSIAATGSKDADGKAIAGTGNLTLQGAQIANTKGTLTLAANNDIDLVEQQLNQSEHTDHAGKSSSLLKKTSTVRISDSRSQEAVGSMILGDNITISAGHDATLRGSSVTGTGDVGIYAKNDVKIVAAEQKSSAAHFEETKKSVTGVGKAIAIAGAVTGSFELAAAALTRKEALQNAERTQTTVIGSAVSGANVAIASGRDTLVKGSTIVADADIDIHAARRLEIVSAQESGSEQAISRSSAKGLIGGLSIGKVKQSQEGTTDSVSQAGSQVASLGTNGSGNVTLKAGEQYTQTASGVLAAEGDIAIAGKNVLINEAYDSSNAAQRSSYSKTATGIEISSPLLSALQGIKSMADAGKKTGDGRMQALAAINAGMNAKAAVDSAQQLANGSLGGIKITASIGSSKSESSGTQQVSTVVGSQAIAGGNVTIDAAGAGKDSNLTAIATDIQAGNNASLTADNQVNLLAAQSTLAEHSENKSSGASIGIGFAFGGGQNGFTLEAAASKARGHADGSDVINVNTHVQAGNAATVTSGGDTTLKGAVITGNSVQADIGGNLAIESLQDSSQFDSKQKSAGIGVSLCIPPFCYGASSVSGSIGKSRVNGDYLGVAEQSGIQAGDGGFDVTVKGGTDLKGAVIASTQAAVDEGKNKLVTASLTQSDLQNHDVYEAKGYSLSATVSGKLGDQSSQAAQSQMSDKDKAAAAAPAAPGASAGTGSAEGSQASVTASGVSGAAITLTDEAKQKELTGQDAATAIAAAQTGVTTDKNVTTSLAKGWDGKSLQDEVNAQVAVTQTFSKIAPKAVADFAGKQAETLRKQGNKEEALKWEEGGIYRVALHTAVGALGGGTAGAAGAGVIASAATELNKLQASVEQALVGQGMSEGAAGMLAQGLAQATAAGIGAVAGGTQGLATTLTVDTNNRQLHPDERKWAKENAAKYQQYLAGKTGETVTLEEAYQRLLSAGYAVVDDAAMKTGKSDETAKQFINEAAPKTLFVATAADRNNPFLNGNADGSYTPEQQSRFGTSGVGAQASAAVTRAMEYVGQSCSDCRAKYTAIDNAVVALQEAKLLYQDDPGSVRLIDQQIDQLKAGITRDELARGMAGAISDKDKGIAALVLGTPSRVVAGAGTAELLERVNLTVAIREVRAGLPSSRLQGGGNVAAAQVDIPGLPSQMAASSRVDKPAYGLVGDGGQNFEYMTLSSADGKLITRNTDSEYKILDNIADRLGNNTSVSGSIKIVTERPACESCLGVVDQFRAKYPNIEVKVFDNNGVMLPPPKKTVGGK